MYTLKTYDGLKLELEDLEAAKILEVINKGTQKNILVHGNYFAIAGIASLTKAQELEEPKDHKLGILHDGTRVVRQFGEWYCIGEYEESGRYVVRPDIDFYPEVRMDCVPSIETFESKYRNLPIEERKALMIGNKDTARYRKAEGMTRIGSTIKSIESATGIAGFCDIHDSFKVDCPCNEQEIQSTFEGE